MSMDRIHFYVSLFNQNVGRADGCAYDIMIYNSQHPMNDAMMPCCYHVPLGR